MVLIYATGEGVRVEVEIGWGGDMVMYCCVCGNKCNAVCCVEAAKCRCYGKGINGHKGNCIVSIMEGLGFKGSVDKNGEWKANKKPYTI